MAAKACITCELFPWAAGFDLAALPAARCHPELKSMRWTQESALQLRGNTCKYYKGKGKARPKAKTKKQKIKVETKNLYGGPDITKKGGK